MVLAQVTYADYKVKITSFQAPGCKIGRKFKQRSWAELSSPSRARLLGIKNLSVLSVSKPRFRGNKGVPEAGVEPARGFLPSGF